MSDIQIVNPEQKSAYDYIHTARGLGYRFEPKPRSSPNAGIRG